MDQTFCKHLRTKSMYTGATTEEAFAEKADEHVTPNHFWCNCTQTVVGVDERPVHKTACVPGRRCYKE